MFPRAEAGALRLGVSLLRAAGERGQIGAVPASYLMMGLFPEDRHGNEESNDSSIILNLTAAYPLGPACLLRKPHKMFTDRLTLVDFDCAQAVDVLNLSSLDEHNHLAS